MTPPFGACLQILVSFWMRKSTGAIKWWPCAVSDGNAENALPRTENIGMRCESPPTTRQQQHNKRTTKQRQQTTATQRNPTSNVSKQSSSSSNISKTGMPWASLLYWASAVALFAGENEITTQRIKETLLLSSTSSLLSTCFPAAVVPCSLSLLGGQLSSLWKMAMTKWEWMNAWMYECTRVQNEDARVFNDLISIRLVSCWFHIFQLTEVKPNNRQCIQRRAARADTRTLKTKDNNNQNSNNTNKLVATLINSI